MPSDSFSLESFPSGPNSQRLAAAAVVVWAVAMVVFFAQLFADSTASSSRLQLAHFSPQQLPQSPQLGVATAMYFMGADCACNRGLGQQIEAQQRRYQGAISQLVTGPSAAIAMPLPGSVRQLSVAEAQVYRAAVPAFPALAVWDAGGQLRYFGPLKTGMDCGVVASPVARAMRQSNMDVVAAAETAGCFCSTSSRSS